MQFSTCPDILSFEGGVLKRDSPSYLEMLIFTYMVHSLHMVLGVVKYKDYNIPTVEGTIVCIEPFTRRALVDLGEK